MSKEENKTIIINPALFQLTKSKKKSTANKKIVPKQHNMTVRKGSRLKSGNVLNYFRKTQNEYLNNLDLRDAENEELKTASATDHTEEESEFDKSVKILKSVCKMVKNEQDEKNAPPKQENDIVDGFPTLLNNSIMSDNIPTSSALRNIKEILRAPYDRSPDFSNISPKCTPISPVPPYGILKNGKLPTYRQYVKNKTFNHNNPMPMTGRPLYLSSALSTPSSYIGEPIVSPAQQIVGIPAVQPSYMTIEAPAAPPSLVPPIPPTPPPPPSYVILTPPSVQSPSSCMSAQAQPLYTTNLSTQQPSYTTLPTAHEPTYIPMSYTPSKKIRRITYKFCTGKNPNKGICSILVPNQTNKEKIIKNTQTLKQTSIKDIKKYLLKRDLIKAGTTAPNDVLRSMYETANLICGEVENHDKEILLHNFLHEDK